MKSGKALFIITLICVVVLAFGAGFGVYQFVKEEGIKMDFVINDNLPNGNGQSARVVLLAGQSNASGCSINEYLEKNVSQEKYLEYKNGFDNVFINYYSSGRNISSGFVKASTGQGETEEHFGPEVGLAEKLHEMCPDETIFIIKFAWGGTNLFSQWLSPSSVGKTGNLYINFVRFVKKNMEYLRSKGYDIQIEGICWMQGESDSFSVENATNYEINLKNFIKDIKKDLAKYVSNNMGFIDAYIANNPVFWVYCDLVNKSKKAVADSSEFNVVIDTNAYGLVCGQEPEGAPDIPHYDSLSQIKLGNLFAEAVVDFFS